MKPVVIARAALVTGAVLLSIAPAWGQDRDVQVKRGEQAFVSQGCYGCHLVGKFGTPIGPDLSLAAYLASLQ